MTNKKLKILIVGVGSIGKRHLANLVRLGYKNILICDPNAGQLEKAAKEFGLSGYRDVGQAIRAEHLAVVFICNPTDRHISTLEAVLRTDADVFIEKPLSNSLTGVDFLARKAVKAKKIVMVGCNFRFHGGFRRLEECIRSGKYGRLLSLRSISGYYLPTARPNIDYKTTYAVRKEKGGGVVLDSGSHVVDYLLALAGEVSSGALVKNRLNPLKTKVEESANMVLEHKNGITSLASFDYFSRKAIHRLEAVTDAGAFTLDFRKDNLIFEDGKTSKTIYRGRADTNQMFVEELKHFMSRVNDHKKPLQDLVAAGRVLKILLTLRTKGFTKNI